MNARAPHAGAIMAGLAALAVACLPGYSEEGARCDREHPCTDPLLQCVQNVCVRGPSPDAGADAGAGDAGGDGGELQDDAGMDTDAGEDGGVEDAGVDAGREGNLLLNADFEAPATDAGRPPYWRANAGVAWVVNDFGVDGGQSVQLVSTTAGPTSLTLLQTQAPVVDPGTEHYCARAWVFVPDGGLPARLMFREFDKGSSLANTAIFPSLTTGEWELIVGDYTAKSRQFLEIRVVVNGASDGGFVFVDDTALWRTQSLACDDL